MLDLIQLINWFHGIFPWQSAPRPWLIYDRSRQIRIANYCRKLQKCHKLSVSYMVSSILFWYNMPQSICCAILSILRVMSDYLALFGGSFSKLFFKKNWFLVGVTITLLKLSKVGEVIIALCSTANKIIFQVNLFSKNLQM